MVRGSGADPKEEKRVGTSSAFPFHLTRPLPGLFVRSSTTTINILVVMFLASTTNSTTTNLFSESSTSQHEITLRPETQQTEPGASNHRLVSHTLLNTTTLLHALPLIPLCLPSVANSLRPER
ncbi:hypothetical protein E2C01_054511 [Portunus trituberculatus]|uniref:Uncharacterized protein n=1 Tax=Portunus trituberculatus TaxID=210409 RepID=A0A5B7GS64_PORTR|nr:hypothetical protein [Portunus trituberculatus]